MSNAYNYTLKIHCKLRGGDQCYKGETRELDKEAQCCMDLATSVLFAINHMVTLKVNGREKPTTSYR